MINDNDIVLEGKIEVLPADISAKIKGKYVRKDKIEAFCKSAISDVTMTFIASGAGGFNDNRLKTAIMAIQMLWNEKEELKEKLVELKNKTETT